MPRQVELEFVNYKIGDIEEATAKMISMFASHSGIAGTDQWMESLVILHNNFKKEKPDNWELRARGLELSFSGITDPIPVIEGGAVVLKPREPRFVLQPVHEQLRPRERTEVEKVTGQIADEMSDVYHLLRLDSPTTLIFPHDRYAQVERISGAVML